MTPKIALLALTAAAVSMSGCSTIYPRKANVDAMQSLRSELDAESGLPNLRAVVTANESALIRVANESREDAASAGPTKAGEQLDSNVLATEASYYLLRLPPEQQISQTMIQALGASVAAFAETASADATSVCNAEGGPGGTKARSCWQADLLFDAVRTAPLVDYLRDKTSTDVAALTDADWRQLTNAMSELSVVFEEEWTGRLSGLNALDSPGEMTPQTQERLKYFMPYLCYADEALVTIATQGGALTTDRQRQMMTLFDVAGSAAIAQGASLPNFSPEPETLESCANDQQMGEALCRINANWAAVSQKCGAIRTCIAQNGDQSSCVSQQVFAAPGS